MKKRLVGLCIIIFACFWFNGTIMAANTVKVDELLTETLDSECDGKRYLIDIPEDIEAKITYSVKKSEEENGYVTFSLYDDKMFYETVYAGKTLSKVVKLKQGSYLLDIGKYQCENAEYSFIIENVTKYTDNVKISKTSHQLNLGGYIRLEVTPVEKGYSTGIIKWTSSNSNVATVNNNGLVKAKNKGNCVITAELPTGKKVTCAITVDKYTNKIKINKKKSTLNVGSSLKLKVTSAENGYKIRDSIKWSSSNNKVATVAQDGKVTAKKKGKCTIYAQADGGKRVTCKITVVKYTKKLKLNKTKYSMYTDNKITLKASPKTKGETIKGTIEWSSSNNKIANVNQKGKVVLLSPGTCKIYAKVPGGKKVQCKITVKKRPDIEIEDCGFSHNFLDGVEPYFRIRNNTGKTIKYMYTTVYCYNSVGDPAYCDIRNSYHRDLKMIGPLRNKKTKTFSFDAVLYNNTVDIIKIKSIKVEFSDGSVKTYNIKKTGR